MLFVGVHHQISSVVMEANEETILSFSPPTLASRLPFVPPPPLGDNKPLTTFEAKDGFTDSRAVRSLRTFATSSSIHSGSLVCSARCVWLFCVVIARQRQPPLCSTKLH